MKRLLLTSTLALLTCLNAAAFTVPITGNGHKELLGSQFSTPDTETLDTYFSTLNSAFPYNGDEVFTWHGSFTAFQYSTDDGQWDPSSTPLPLGTAFWYVPAASHPGFTINNAGLGLMPHNHLPLTVNQYYYLSSTAPLAATYQNLLGYPGAVPAPNPQTFVWTWSSTAGVAGDWDAVYRYRSGGWKKLPYPAGPTTPMTPSIPLGHGALVGWFQTSPGPLLQSATPGGACPPNVTLTLTFSAPLDPISAATTANYKILKAAPGCAAAAVPLGGFVQSVSLQWSANSYPPVVQTVVLVIAPLYSQSCNTYFVSSTVTDLGGSPNTSGPLMFNPFCTAGSPANDHPLDALNAPFALASPAHVTGSLTCADATPTGLVLPLGFVQNFPTDAGALAKDVWYSFTPGASGGIVTVDTCPATPAACPESNTSLAVYQRNAAGLIMITPPTLISSVPDMDGLGTDPLCLLNHGAAQVTFNAKACATYYIRVAGKFAGAASPLPGGFTLNLVQQPATAPANDDCSAAQVVTANSSTRFDNWAATTDGPVAQPIDNDVWFRFQGPFGGGLATVETCTANFDTALAVYSGGCLNLVLKGYDLGGSWACTPFASQVTFAANQGQNYYIRVGTRSGAPVGLDRGCGSVHVSCAIPPTPPPNVLPTGAIAGTGLTYCKTYQLMGLGANVPWTWSLTAPPISGGLSGLNVQDTIPGVANNAPALVIATAFAQSINTDCGLVIVATAFPSVPPDPDAALLQICSPYPQNELVLKVGSSLPPTCWVDFFQLNTVGACAFNPQIFAMGDADSVALDCNGNGQADFLDILQGISSDVNGDGIPDECQGCIGVVIAGGPDPTIGNLGGTATFAVHPLGSGPFSYQWRKDGTPLGGETNATLAFSNLPLEAAGLYDVIVTNACGQDTSPGAALFVDPQPVLNVAQAGPNVVLSWSADAADYHLQANPALNNATTWTDLPGDSPVTVPIDAQVRYFRLLQNP